MISVHSPLAAAIAFYSGGVVIDTRRPEWTELETRINSSPYTPYEFVFFMAFFKDVPPVPAIITNRNHMCSQKCWAAFQTFKDGRLEDVRILVGLQIRVFADRQHHGCDPLRLLLDDGNLDVGPVTRVALALKLATTGLDITKVLGRYRFDAVGIILGSPEYLQVLPGLHAWYDQQPEVPHGC